MRKMYSVPTAEMICFDYSQNVVASEGEPMALSDEEQHMDDLTGRNDSGT